MLPLTLVGVVAAVVLTTVGPVAARPEEGDATRGAALFRFCVACHSTQPGVHLAGPSLAHVWGRRAGTVDGYTRYSEPLVQANVIWDQGTLDRWLEAPQSLVPGNAMTFQGMTDPQQRADLAAFLEAVASGQAPPVQTPSGRMMTGPRRPNLKNVGPDRQIRMIRYCGDGYHVTTQDGRTVPFWEFNLRFKTDSSPEGPSPGRPVIVPSGMQGDRASVVFASPDEISRSVESNCLQRGRTRP